MIDDQKEENAALYALDLLESPEREAFEAELSRDPALRKLVDELRQSSNDLALLAKPAQPPTALRDRVLASVTASSPGGGPRDAETERSQADVIPVRFGTWLGWAAAACFALGTGYFSAHYIGARGQAGAALERAELAEMQNKGLQQQLEAVDIVHKTQIAALQRAADISQLKIAKLVSLASDKKAAVAIAVWNPVRQEGVLRIENLPALAADEDYQLWVIDPQRPNQPVSSVVFAVGEDGAGRHTFRPDEPVSSAAVFAVSREHKGGSTTAKGPQGAVIATGEL
jgi:anti-sigma-K factor RskA